MVPERPALRALFCLNGPDELNGPNVWLTRHLPRLRRHGIEPRVLYLSMTPGEPCRFREALAAEGIPSRAVRLEGITENDVHAILEGVRAERPDVFVPNYSVPAYFACHRARLAGIRTVGVFHADDPYYHDLLDWFVAGPEPWRLDGVAAVSEYLSELVVARSAPPTRVLHASCGALVSDAPADPPGEVFRLLYVGRLVDRQKRVLRVADRLCAAATTFPDVEAVLYGDGPLRPDVEALAAQRAPGRVRVESRAPNAMGDAMRTAHALVLLSDFEGMSMALMEAMACGLVPIVSGTRSGTDDLVRHEANGLVVDPDSEASFLAGVRRLREEPGLWLRLSGAARQTIIDRGYTSDECARRWAEFCKGLRPDVPPVDLDVPVPEDLELPPECQRQHGIRVADWRLPWQRLMTANRWGRPIYVWGAGRAGRLFLEGSTGRRLHVAGVIDGNATGLRTAPNGVEIHPPSRLDDDLRDGRRPFVVVASMHSEEISGVLTGLGLEPERDFNLAGCWP
jgi:glycosyltransferase involved in cell wall biosynthesis